MLTFVLGAVPQKTRITGDRRDEPSERDVGCIHRTVSQRRHHAPLPVPFVSPVSAHDYRFSAR